MNVPQTTTHFANTPSTIAWDNAYDDDSGSQCDMDPLATTTSATLAPAMTHTRFRAATTQIVICSGTPIGWRRNLP